MTKKLIQLRNLIIAVIFLETLIVLGLYLLTKKSSLFMLSVYVFVKNIIILACLFYISNHIEENAMSVSDALNNDAKNAYLFGVKG